VHSVQLLMQSHSFFASCLSAHVAGSLSFCQHLRRGLPDSCT
jgi:hypothetical protein